MNRIYTKVCDSLKEENSILSKVTLNTLTNSNVYSIVVEDGRFWFEFNEIGYVLNEAIYIYLIKFIERKFGYKFILDDWEHFFSKLWRTIIR